MGSMEYSAPSRPTLPGRWNRTTLRAMGKAPELDMSRTCDCGTRGVYHMTGSNYECARCRRLRKEWADWCAHHEHTGPREAANEPQDALSDAPA